MSRRRLLTIGKIVQLILAENSTRIARDSIRQLELQSLTAVARNLTNTKELHHAAQRAYARVVNEVTTDRRRLIGILPTLTPYEFDLCLQTEFIDRNLAYLPTAVGQVYIYIKKDVTIRSKMHRISHKMCSTADYL